MKKIVFPAPFSLGECQLRFNPPRMMEVSQAHTPTRKHEMLSSGSPFSTLPSQHMTDVPQTDDHQASQSYAKNARISVKSRLTHAARCRELTGMTLPRATILQIRF